MTRFAVVGDLMLDVTAIASAPLAHASDTPARVSMQPGGSAANTAAWLAVTGHTAVLVGSIGEDAAGTTLVDGLAACGVELALTRQPDLPTGVCVVLVDAAAERTMLPDRGANRRAPVVPADLLGPGTHVHLSGYVLLDPERREAGAHLLARARAEGSTTSIDCASAAPLEEHVASFRDAVAGCDLLLANADESRILGGLPGMRELVRTAVEKRGADGAALLRDAGIVTASAHRVPVVDATGAGDAFAAGFLPAWVSGIPDAAALEAGARLAARAVSRVGAGPSPLDSGESSP